MDAYILQWNRCLGMIREQLHDDHIYKTWFNGITLDGYDESENCVTLCVPSHYVYEYIEQLHIPMMQQVLNEAFKPGIRLQYRLARQEPSFGEVADYLRQQGYDPRRDTCNIRIANARRRLEDGLKYFLPEGYTWIAAYDQVAEWLTDNKGRGLLCVGTTGLGKSLVCQKLLPVILGNGGRPITSVLATELKARAAELMKERILIIDDLGKEPRKHFGDIDNTFFELCNNAERKGNLLIITTNLSTTPVNPQWRQEYPCSIEERYGREVLDRLSVITKAVLFTGKSMRR